MLMFIKLFDVDLAVTLAKAEIKVNRLKTKQKKMPRQP